MYHLKGSCHCGNITVDISLTQPPIEYSPRACDCDFCRKHGASYISDPGGSLVMHVNGASGLHMYRQGNNIADMVICADCGVLAGAMYRTEDNLYAVINSLIIDGNITFSELKTASPKQLTADKKVKRWTDLWFSSVVLDDSIS